MRTGKAYSTHTGLGFDLALARMKRATSELWTQSVLALGVGSIAWATHAHFSGLLEEIVAELKRRFDSGALWSLESQSFMERLSWSEVWRNPATLSAALGTIVGFATIRLVVFEVERRQTLERGKHGYKVVSAEELNAELDRWFWHYEKVLEDVKSRSEEDWFDLGAATGEEARRLRHGLYLTLGREKAILPESALKVHVGVAGTTGTGKTLTIMQAIDQLRRAPQQPQGIVPDYNGELYARFGKPGDIVLCPFDTRTASFDIFKEDILPREIAEALIEDDPKDKFFAPNARNLFVDLMRLCTSQAEMQATMNQPLDDLRDLLFSKNCDSAAIFDSKKTASNILQTMKTNLEMLSYMRHWNPRGKPFSLIEWAVSSDPRWVWIIIPDKHQSTLKPWVRVWIHLAVKGAMARNIFQSNREMVIIGDEIPIHGNIPSLPKIPTNGRRYGLHLFAGYQNRKQWFRAYGEAAYEILACLRCRMVFNPGPEGDDAKEAAAILGQDEVSQLSKSQSFNTNDRGGGETAGINESVREQFLVSPTELQNLPDLEFYLKLPFKNPVKLTAVAEKFKALQLGFCEGIPPGMRSGALA